MEGVLNAGGGRVAKIKVRITVANTAATQTVRITDVMLQPGAAVSGWLPHVTELPWSAGVGS